MTPMFVALILVTPPVSKPYEPPFTPEQVQHWSFQTPAKTQPPKISGLSHPIDQFLLARLQAVKLQMNPEADRTTLIRRLSLDVIGLPPTVAEIDAFLADTSTNAYEKLVDRLLASPLYGERWAQHWLDVVRYAETNGYELDMERSDAWRYRDYVIRSFNDDKPYSQFIREQIAGDELAKGKPAADVAELLIATGMHRCGPVHVVSGNLDQAQLREERLTEMVNGVGAAVLGLTLGCARCHDHKFDPLSQADYYRLQAFFASADYHDYPLSTKQERDAFTTAQQKAKAASEPLQKQVSDIEAVYRAKILARKKSALPEEARVALETPAAKRTDAQKKLAKDVQPLLNISWDEVVAELSPQDRARREGLREQIRQIELALPVAPAKAWGLKPSEKIPPTHILKRGDPARKSEMVAPGFPKILSSQLPPEMTRTALADWMVQPNQPLTSRVMVNRIWHHYFGSGIVRTINDFGTRGDLPSHPELLDWLASKLVESGWKLKPIHKTILMSAAYRQTADARPEALKADPDNRLVWRMNRKRLDAEAIRDSILAASGLLVREQGGPSIRVPLEPEVYDLIFTEAEPDGLWPVTPDPRQHGRRSIYLFAKRNVRLPMLEAFDQPDTLTPCNGRMTSTFAPQALILMNGPFSSDQSRAMAGSLTDKEPVNEIYRRTLGRLPTVKERAIADQFLKQQAESIRARLLARKPVLLPEPLPADADPARLASLADLCLAIFNTNEFVYVP